MATKQVMIGEISKDMFVIQQHSPLVKMIEFGYILHSFMIDSEIIKENEWIDFAFGINLKIIDSNDDIIILNTFEVNGVLEWLDWICRVLVNSEGEHNNSSFVKNFLSTSDKLFKDLRHLNIDEEIMIEKLK